MDANTLQTRLQGSLQSAPEAPDHKKQGYHRRTRQYKVISARKYKMFNAPQSNGPMDMCFSARGNVRPRLPARLTDRGARWFPLH